MGEMMILLWRPKHVSNPIDFDYERVEKEKNNDNDLHEKL